MANAMLFDSSRCIACRGCQAACKQWWELPAVVTANRGSYENPPELGPETWNKIRFREVSTAGATRWLFTRQACMHCSTAVCVWVCPSFARTYDEDGHCAIDRERCIGCGRCVEYCPFEVPKLGPHDITPRVTVELYTPRKVAHKCSWCGDRIEAGLTPACVKTCPPGALQFGERSSILQEAKKRLEAVKNTFPEASIYGEKEMGGLHSVYLITDPPYVHGLPENPRIGSYPKFDADGFPDWYISAINRGDIPLFPANARREWYMEPDLKPTSPLRGAPPPKSNAFLEGKEALAWGWVGTGVAAASLGLIWAIKRRQNGSNSNVEDRTNDGKADRE